jgi:hypothetical protein
MQERVIDFASRAANWEYPKEHSLVVKSIEDYHLPASRFACLNSSLESHSLIRLNNLCSD